MGKQKNKINKSTQQPIKEWPIKDPTSLALHVLDLNNRIHTLEKILNQLSMAINDLVMNVNKTHQEFSAKLQTLSMRIDDHDKIMSLKSEKVITPKFN